VALKEHAMAAHALGHPHATHAPAATAAGRGHIPWAEHQQLRLRGLYWGLAAGLAMLGVYFGVLWAANSLDHALSELAALWMWMMPIVVGFAFQVGLFAYARGAARGTHAHAGGVVASGGLSTASMVACCAHHVTDVLPFVGLAGASMFLAQYQTVFLALGVASNVTGTAYMLRMFRQHHFGPDRSSLLTAVLRFPFDRAFPWILGASVTGFLVALVYELLL
jgi:hypothetical protein